MATQLTNKRIFLIEDNIGNRAITQTLLEQAGAKIAFERWGTDVIKRLEEFIPIDLILLDLMFPRGITGFDIFDQIRTIPDFNTVPIVAISASDPGTAIPKAREKGFSGFISKPIRYETFITQIVSILSHEPIWDAG